MADWGLQEMKCNKNKSFWESTKNALRGFGKAFLLERNVKIDAGAVLFVAFFAYEYGVSSTEAILLTLIMALVLMAELFNTAIEKGLDAITTEYNENIRLSKDISAAAVTIVALAAVVCAVFIFSDTTRLMVLWSNITSMPQKLIKFAIIVVYEAIIVFRKDKIK